MKGPKENPEVQKDPLFKERTVQFREFDVEAAEAELRVRLPELEAEIAKLEDAQFVSNEAMLLEFSI